MEQFPEYNYEIFLDLRFDELEDWMHFRLEKEKAGYTWDETVQLWKYGKLTDPGLLPSSTSETSDPRDEESRDEGERSR